MRFTTTAIVPLLLADAYYASASSTLRGGLRHGKNQLGVRRTLSEECAVVVVKHLDEKVFECELDPSDANGEVGARRTLKATPRQLTQLRRLHESGELKEGEHLIVHGAGAEYDNESLYLPEDLSMSAAVMGRGERRLAAGLFGNDNGNGNNRNGGNRKDYIVTFASNKDAGPASKCDALAKRNNGKMNEVYTKVLNGCMVSLTERAANGLKKNPNIAFVEEDGIVTASANSWGLDRINQMSLPLDNAATKINAQGVKVYIVDTGLNGSHQDFAGMIDSTDSCHMSSFNDGLELNDGNGHGTHVGSTTCGKDYGVADNCQLCAVRVLDNGGSGSWSGVIAGFDHVAADCQGQLCVLNASLGGGASASVNAAVAGAVNAGVVAVVAAGNESTDACTKSPASEPLAITVGSTTSTDGISGFSNYGSCVDVYAPGSGITAAWIGSNTATTTISGTSMASPHVAGIAAGVLSANPTYTPANVQTAIESAWTNVGIDSRTPGVGLATIFGTDSDFTSSPTPAPTPCSGMDVSVELTTDNYPGETAWSFTNTCAGSGGQRFDGPSYSTPATTVTTEMCLPSGQYDFTITDSWGDGICCGYGSGSYKVYMNGAMMHEGGEFSSSDTKVIGSCSNTPSPTDAPTAPPTDAPTRSPTTDAPTTSPTDAPTNPPVAPPAIQQAVYDAALGAPKCGTASAACTTGAELINGKRGNLEQNPSNTVDSCVDGPYGTYHNDESIDSIMIRSADGGALEAGKRVEFETLFWAWSTGAADTVEYYHTADATAASPVWELIGTVYPSRGGAITSVGEYDLPANPGVHAFRARIRYSGSAGACGSGYWDDTDDLAFAVAPAAGGASTLGPKDPPQVFSGLKRDFECDSLDEDRCGGAGMCKWKNGRKGGCFAKGNGKN